MKAVMSEHGPQAERQRHLCQVIERHIRGTGLDGNGCFASHRALGVALHVSRTTIARTLVALEIHGWVATVSVRRQFGRVGKKYFPAVPDAVLEAIGSPKDVPIRPTNGARSVGQSGNGTGGGSGNGTFSDRIGTSGRRIGTPMAVPESSILNLQLKAPASPNTADAGAVGAEPAQSERSRELRSFVLSLRDNYTDEEIVRFARARYDPPPTLDEVQAVQ